MPTTAPIPSKSFIGYLVLGLTVIFGFFGVDIKPDASALTEAVFNFASATATLIGAALALWGHIQQAREHGALRQLAYQAGVPAPAINEPVGALKAQAVAAAKSGRAELAVLACLFGACLLLAACSTYSANLTTTKGSAAATVDNAGPIAAGAAIASANTATNTTVLSIASTNLVLSANATADGTVVATFQNTVAVQFKDDITSYTQTVVNFLYTESPVILQNVGNAAKLTAALGSDLQAWGLDPVNPQQRTALGNIIDIASKVATSSQSLTSTLSGIQATGAVPVAK